MVAAPREAEAVLRGVGAPGDALPEPWSRFDLDDRLALVLSGVGKANASGAVVRAARAGDGGVVSLGLAGALPGANVEVGQVVVADACLLADEGVETPEAFLSQSALGFPALGPHGERIPTDAGWTMALAPLAARVGAVATISTCAGTDKRAQEIARRTGALVEDMESAAAGLAAARLDLPFACVRIVSNRTGDRARQGWDLARAFAALERVAAAL